MLHHVQRIRCPFGAVCHLRVSSTRIARPARCSRASPRPRLIAVRDDLAARHRQQSRCRAFSADEGEWDGRQDEDPEFTDLQGEDQEVLDPEAAAAGEAEEAPSLGLLLHAMNEGEEFEEEDIDLLDMRLREELLDSNDPPFEETLSDGEWLALMANFAAGPDPELFQDGPGKVAVEVAVGGEEELGEGEEGEEEGGEAAAEAEAEAAAAAAAEYAEWNEKFQQLLGLPPGQEEYTGEQLREVLGDDSDEEEEGGEGEGEEEDIDPDTELGGKYTRPPERATTLSDLLRAAEELQLAEDTADNPVMVFGLTDDPDEITVGDIYCCVGEVTPDGPWDGHDEVEEAIQLGAAAILARQGEDLGELPVPVVYVPDVEEMAQRLAAILYGVPSQQMRVVGVAGSSGKTTISWLVRGVLEELGLLAGMVGSIEYAIAEDLLTPQGDLWQPVEPDLTTDRESSTPYHLTPYQGRYSVDSTMPNGLRLQKLLSGMYDRGATAAVLELTSEGLAGGATTYLDIDLAIFSNHIPSEDLLLLHGSQEAYLAAQLLLFEQLDEPEKQRAVVNLDDQVAPLVLEACHVPVVTYSAGNSAADVYAEDVKLSMWETELIVRTPTARLQIISGLVGRHNVPNILAAVAAGVAMGAPADVIVSGIEAVETVPGRAEVVNAPPLDDSEEKLPDAFAVVVDAANSPERLATLLDSLREIAGSNRLFTVFGCDGEVGSSAARAAMGEIAHSRSDYVIVTNTSPRGEVPSAIVEDIVAGWPEAVVEPYAAYVYNPFQDQGNVPLWFEPFLHSAQRRMQRYIMEDRYSAIRAAIGTAKRGDVVVLAGQGSRDYVEHWDGEEGLDRGWFDDRVEARDALSKLSYLYSVTDLKRDTLPWGDPPDEKSVVVELDV